MTEQGRATDVNEAARRFAETLAESYRLVYEQAAESGERQQRRAQEFSELVARNLKEQTEASRSTAQQLSEQAHRQQQAGQEFAGESVEAYAEFLDDAFSRYQIATERAAGTAAGVVGAATGAIADATAEGASYREDGRLPYSWLRRDERGGDLGTPGRPFRGGAAASARLRGAQQEARHAP